MIAELHTLQAERDSALALAERLREALRQIDRILQGKMTNAAWLSMMDLSRLGVMEGQE